MSMMTDRRIRHLPGRRRRWPRRHDLDRRRREVPPRRTRARERPTARLHPGQRRLTTSRRPGVTSAPWDASAASSTCSPSARHQRGACPRARPAERIDEGRCGHHHRGPRVPRRVEQRRRRTGASSGRTAARRRRVRRCRTGPVHAVEPSRAIDVGYTPRDRTADRRPRRPRRARLETGDRRRCDSHLAPDARQPTLAGSSRCRPGRCCSRRSVGSKDARRPATGWPKVNSPRSGRPSRRRAPHRTMPGGWSPQSGALAAIQVVDELADHARWAEWMP